MEPKPLASPWKWRKSYYWIYMKLLLILLRPGKGYIQISFYCSWHQPGKLIYNSMTNSSERTNHALRLNLNWMVLCILNRMVFGLHKTIILPQINVPLSPASWWTQADPIPVRPMFDRWISPLLFLLYQQILSLLSGSVWFSEIVQLKTFCKLRRMDKSSM